MPTALVTGASRGLGYAVAMALAPTHHVVAVARTVGGLEELDDRIQASGGQATLAPMDITVPEAMRQLARSIFDRWGKLDLWIHAAIHAGPLAPAGHLATKDFDRSIAVNLRATADLIAVLNPLLSPSGHAVFFDDASAGEKFFGHYGSTKAGQIALARSWQAEGERIGPRVSILEPWPMPTATRSRFFPGENRAALTSPQQEAARLLPAILG
ncbi:SDR family oxidoreductase [Rubellimicrobium rubrum]|uniref:SDR family oxidoreductase n=1 Tax=Rubellimicrobium rubrum TaxID=2585369 RepID=A0A5C4MYI7_9RHOB|nr:SDR family oxidoreductase [Rubellimicrobium rubrum]TNC50744.1 SDR family oxidoreductase [Rubellimicrobium rubrum]